MAGLSAKPPAHDRRLWYRLSRLQYLWNTKNPLTVALLPLSWLFCAAVSLRRAVYRLRNATRSRWRAPVIVVGNISLGGTGKTPLVIWLAQRLEAAGFRPGIISRGYGGRASRWPQMVTGDSDPALVGDEPVLMAIRTGCPLAVAPRRNLAARALLDDQACDVLICDDGLQHYNLIRDIEIAVIDGIKGLGNGWCLPAGPLRESPARLREVDFIVSQGVCAVAQFSMALHGDRVVNLADASRVASLDDFGESYVHAVAGIGNPARFFDMLRSSGLALQTHAFVDHHSFRPADIDFDDSRPVLMTEKDAVKCRAFAKAHHWYVPVTAVLEPRLAQEIIDLLQFRTLVDSRLERRSMETIQRGQETARYSGLSRHQGPARL